MLWFNILPIHSNHMLGAEDNTIQVIYSKRSVYNFAQELFRGNSVNTSLGKKTEESTWNLPYSISETPQPPPGIKNEIVS